VVLNKSSALLQFFNPEDVKLVTNFCQLCLEACPIVGRLVSVGCFERIDSEIFNVGSMIKASASKCKIPWLLRATRSHGVEAGTEKNHGLKLNKVPYNSRAPIDRRIGYSHLNLMTHYMQHPS